MFFGQFTEMMPTPRWQAFGERKPRFLPHGRRKSNQIAACKFSPGTDDGFPTLGLLENRLGEERTWARIVARLIAVAVAQW
jgi:hypothetical protein